MFLEWTVMEEARPSGEDIGSTKAQKRLLYPVDGSGGELGASWLENVSTGELLPHPHHLWQVGELGMPLTSCGTPEIWPCASPGQYTTADPVSREGSVPAQGYECERDGPTTALPCNSTSPPAAGGRTGPWGHESRRANPVPCLGSTVELVSWTR